MPEPKLAAYTSSVSSVAVCAGTIPPPSRPRRDIYIHIIIQILPKTYTTQRTQAALPYPALPYPALLCLYSQITNPPFATRHWWTVAVFYLSIYLIYLPCLAIVEVGWVLGLGLGLGLLGVGKGGGGWDLDLDGWGMGWVGKGKEREGVVLR